MPSPLVGSSVQPPVPGEAAWLNGHAPTLTALPVAAGRVIGRLHAVGRQRVRIDSFPYHGRDGLEPMLAQGLLEGVSARASDALVDREGLPQVGGGLTGVAVSQVAMADSLQGACFLEGSADVAGEGQGLAVVVAGLAR